MIAKTILSDLQLIEKQNKTLNSVEWHTISTKADQTGQTLVCLVDKDGIQTINAFGNKGYLGLGRITFVNLSKYGAKEDSTNKPPTQVGSNSSLL